ncbi:serine/threonine-protein kinase [Tautonia plasticadhaerens]|uniref:serine/threonine-protein kinase n=1 Tax=Tautonia plasticadhaerens TaxID=2527974 RepID=UPI0018D20191|nr:serine/threonine-protein kinase [Tautonia plasticadhaerens]
MAVGEVVGERYEVLGPLGHGGLGQVYRAPHRGLGREVALKIIRAGRHDEHAVRRFEREMKAVGLLDHPNLVRATDGGVSRGRPYLVMDLVLGNDLERLVRRLGPLPVAEACELARQAARGLQALHEKKLVHRDIKPSNLMLTPEGVVKVLDFGLARLVEDVADSLTQNGSMGGTADYLAPEQADDLRSATIRSDLYSLGCTLYCLLAGRPPFGDDRHEGLTRKIVAHRQEPVPPITRFRPELAGMPGLLCLQDRLLAKKPVVRPAEPREVAEALAPWAVGHDLSRLFDDDMASLPKGEPISETSSIASETFPSPGRWRRRAGWAAAVLGLGAVVGIISRNPEVEGQGGPAPPVPVAPDAAPAPDLAATPLVIESLDVERFQGNTRTGQGTIRVLTFSTRSNDNVRVKAQLNEPAYCYLIALNPDGSVSFCPKAEEGTPPSPTTEIDYPAGAGD